MNPPNTLEVGRGRMAESSRVEKAEMVEIGPWPVSFRRVESVSLLLITVSLGLAQCLDNYRCAVNVC